MDSLLERAFADGHLQILLAGRREKIRYVSSNKDQIWTDPEEKVRAQFYAELIYRYGYKPARMDIEVPVPDRTPFDFADLIIFSDDHRKRPFAVIECKKELISDAAFAQAVEQAWGNGNAAKFRAHYIGVVAGETRRFLDCDDSRFGALERDENIVADLPTNYGRPPEWKYRRGGR